MYFSDETKALLEERFGKSLAEISRMNLDEEIAFVEKRTGRKLCFSTDVDPRMISRGNPLLAQGRFVTEKKTGIGFKWLQKLFEKLR